MVQVDFGYKDVPSSKKSEMVSAVFESVASRYDIMNDVMSLGAHRYWKQVLLSMMTVNNDKQLLDVAGGSGDVARLFLDSGGGSAIICDLSSAMLFEGRKKSWDRGVFSHLDYVNGDAESLPFADKSFDIYSISFGLRNVTDRVLALSEAHRVLKTGGQFFCLEFCPEVLPILSSFYDFYSFRVIPFLGDLITNDRASYRYLVESIRRFPKPDILSSLMEEAGFRNVKYRLLSGGIVSIHSGYRICV